MTMGETLDFSSDTFDATISVGVPIPILFENFVNCERFSRPGQGRVS